MAVNLKQLEDQISNLSAEQLKQFRMWYDEFDAENWDKQIEIDAKAEKFKHIANEALSEHTKGKTRRLRNTMQVLGFGRSMKLYLNLYGI